MLAEEVFERYVREVAGQLPVRMRADVSLEIASLLREDLRARAAASGNAADEKLARAVAADFGHPHEVADRYHPRWAIIDPSDTRNFVLSVIIGGAILFALSVPAALLSPGRSRGPEAPLLAWTGLVVAFFALRSWSRRRRPTERRWSPSRNDRDRVSAPGLFAIVAAIGICIALFAQPQRTFASITGNGHLGDWLRYDPGFRARRLPWLLAVWAAQAVMLGVVALGGRWSSPLRQLEIGLSIALVALLAWFRTGPVMAEPAADQTTRAFLAMFALLVLIDVGVKLYNRAGHLGEAKLREALGAGVGASR